MGLCPGDVAWFRLELESPDLCVQRIELAIPPERPLVFQ